MTPLKIVTHSKRVLSIAERFGWLPGARYTNLRDIRSRSTIGLIDICWKDYDFDAHYEAVKKTRPLLTVARDITDISAVDKILEQATLLAEFAQTVIVVPKDPRMKDVLNEAVPERFRLGFSVPTKYGGSPILPRYFRRPVHLLGGRPDVQRQLASLLDVASLDCNRFTLDAAYGDYFDGDIFRPHPQGGYDICISDSLKNINALWNTYEPCNSGRVASI